MGKGFGIVFSVMAILVLGGCADNNEEALEKVQAAAYNSQSIQNAVFSVETITENEAEKVEQQVEGGFIKTGEEEYDIYYKSYSGEEGTSAISEFAVIDGKEYSRVLVDSEVESDWFSQPEQTDTKNNYITVFFENEWTTADIKKVDVSETNGHTQYEFLMSEAYNERIKAENVRAVEESIDFMIEKGMDNKTIDMMEEQLEINQNTDFQEQRVTYLVNEEDFLITADYQSSIIPPDGQAISFRNISAITDYHLSDISQLIPVIENE